MTSGGCGSGGTDNLESVGVALETLVSGPCSTASQQDGFIPPVEAVCNERTPLRMELMGCSYERIFDKPDVVAVCGGCRPTRRIKEVT